APSVAHELACTCTRRSRLETIARTTWFRIMSVGASASAMLAVASFTNAHQTAEGLFATAAALGLLGIRRLPLVSIQTRIEVHGGFRFAIGCLAIAVGLFIQGGGWGIASGICYVIFAVATTLGCWKLNSLAAEGPNPG